MSHESETFFTSVGCMDGRVHKSVLEYGQKRYGAKYADTITEAGIVGSLAVNPVKDFLESVRKKVLISVEKHGSKGIVVHGHDDCAGNPVEDTLHREQTVEAAREVRNFVSGDIEVMPVFVIRDGDNWVVEEL